MTSLDLQVYSFSVMVLAGVVLGLCLDTYRVLRLFWRPGWAGTALGDLLFGSVCGLLLASALLLASWGDLRLYVFLGLVAGFGLYQGLAGDLYRRRLTSVLRLTGRVSTSALGAAGRLLAMTAAGLLLFLQPFFWLADVTAEVALVLSLPVLRSLRPIQAWGRKASGWPAGVWRRLRRRLPPPD